MVDILIIGSGAREHAIAQTLKQSSHKPCLYAYMAWKNPGIISLCTNYLIGNYNDLNSIGSYATKIRPEFCIIGPEAPLAEGVVDLLQNLGIPSVGPNKACAQLESSKSFTRNLMQKHSIPGLPRFHVFDSIDGIGEFIDMLSEEGKGFVVKPDGLTGGKGVKVLGDHLRDKRDALEYCKEILAAGKVVVEEKLDGEEFSIQYFTDGKTVVPMPCAQDHKRAFEDDIGPNTGGMGSYSYANHLLAFMDTIHAQEALNITRRVAKAIHSETGSLYKGIMYGGFMLTRDGVKLIEYNARFADPESINVLPILVTDLVEICRAIISGSLSDMQIIFEKKSTVCKYVVPLGYPDKPAKGETISLDITGSRAKVFYASVEQTSSPGKFIMLGSRAIAFVGIADSITDAEKIAEEAASSVAGKIYHRKDIGTQKLLQKRADHMQAIQKS